jgi:CRISPR-associated protein Csm3
MKLMKIKKLSGTLKLVSGLHIGAGDMEMHIGGTDNPVIKHPHTNEPFIPGSSLKGKVRSLLEMTTGAMIATRGNPLSVADLDRLSETADALRCRNIVRLFGSGGMVTDMKIASEIGPTRVSFADCAVSPSYREKADATALPWVEVKAENSINRISGTAENPRFTERVPAGAEFDFSVTLKVLGDEDELFDLLIEGLALLELDYLGGSGSRGYGRVHFEFEDPYVREKMDAHKKRLMEEAA